MKKIIEYIIYKDFKDAPEYWDGPFKSLREAAIVFYDKYHNDIGKQSFVIARANVTPIRLRKIKK
jgi:hypothetical protein